MLALTAYQMMREQVTQPMVTHQQLLPPPPLLLGPLVVLLAWLKEAGLLVTWTNGGMMCAPTSTECRPLTCG